MPSTTEASSYIVPNGMGVTVDRPNRSIDTPRKLGIADESVCIKVEHLDLDADRLIGNAKLAG
ncbi:MAG TPA: hypothetical protein PKN67_04905, partial [Pseudomonadales bacterium]|nr:hypothetical protein [Pseudomonadales bacterium]